MNVTGTSTVSGKLNWVQRIMDIFVGGSDINSNEEGIKPHWSNGVEHKKVEV